jgi:SSS family solute:Na+ symporter
MVAFGLLDWIVLILSFVGLFALIFWVVYVKQETDTDYFLASRSAGWLVIGASIWASNIGSEHLVGLAGAGAESGLAMAHWEMHAWLILILGWVFVPFYSKCKIFTMPEFLERRFDSRCRSVLSVISIISYVLTKVAVTVYAGGIVFKYCLGIETLWGIDFFWISAIGLVIITGLYTIAGGMRAVLYTSVLQTPIIVIGCALILIIGLVKLGGWSELVAICESVKTGYDGDTMMTLVRSANDPEFPWTGVLFAAPIIGFWYWCTDQYIVQRVLSAKNMKMARRGSIFAAYLKLTPVFIFLIPGMIAFALDKKGIITLESSDAAFPTLVSALLPAGLKGLVVAGLVAALMSSLSSLFNSSAALFTEDFYKKYRPNKNPYHYVVVGRIATTVIVILGILWIPIMRGLGEVLYKYLQDVQSLLAPGIAATFLLGVFSKRVNSHGAFYGLMVGMVLGLLRLFLNVIGIPEDTFLYNIFLSHNWLHYCIYLFIICIILILGISYLTNKPSEEKVTSLTIYTLTKEDRKEIRSTWNKWDVIHTVIILAFIVWFYAYFWK